MNPITLFKDRKEPDVSQKIISTNFAVMNPEKDDFLMMLDTSKRDVVVKAWHPDPGKALKFKTQDKAQKALELVKGSYELSVVRIDETATQFLVEGL